MSFNFSPSEISYFNGIGKDFIGPDDPRLHNIQKFLASNINQSDRNQTKLMKKARLIEYPNNLLNSSQCNKKVETPPRVNGRSCKFSLSIGVPNNFSSISSNLKKPQEFVNYNQIPTACSQNQNINNSSFPVQFPCDNSQILSNLEKPQEFDNYNQIPTACSQNQNINNSSFPVQFPCDNSQILSNLEKPQEFDNYNQIPTACSQNQNINNSSFPVQFPCDNSQILSYSDRTYSDLLICAIEIEQVFKDLPNYIDLFELQTFVNNWFQLNKYAYADVENAVIRILFSNVFHAIETINNLKNTVDDLLSNEKKIKENHKMEIMRNKKEIKKKTKININSNSLIRMLRSQIEEIKNERDQKKKLLHDIFEKCPDIQEILNELEYKEAYGPPILSNVIIDEMIKNLKFKPNGRRYSLTLKKICFIISTYSSAAYEKIRDFIPLPSSKTLNSEFKVQLNETKSNLLNIDQLHLLLKKLHMYYTANDDEIIPCTLAVDAATMNPQETGKSGFFGFHLQPFNVDYDSKIIHIAINSNSRFNDEILEIMNKITRIAKESNFDIIIHSTDADTKTNVIHNNLQKFLNNMKLNQNENAGFEQDENTVFEQDENTVFEQDENTVFEQDENTVFEQDENTVFEQDENTVFEQDENTVFEQDENTGFEQDEGKESDDEDDEFEILVDKLKDYDLSLPTSDLMHLLKALKRRYLSNDIKMTYLSKAINKDTERIILELSPYNNAKIELDTSIARMRDSLALMLINTKNTVIAGENEHHGFFVFEFVLVLMLEIIQSKTLSIDARRKLCKVAYYSMKEINDNSISRQRSRKGKKNKKKSVCFVNSNTYKRIINNLLCYGFVFKYFNGNISTARLGSHPLELVFGLIRQCSRGNDTSETAERVIAKSLLRDEFMEDLGKKKTHVRGRCKIAGSTPSDGWDKDIPIEIDLKQIPHELIGIANHEYDSDDFKSSNAWALATFLDENSPTTVPNLSGDNTGRAIINRLINLETH
ncbi:hypothetical protein M9Y10_035065 [Tritrichomonas musculus]|uniref:Uncharacterized protein n=1 Tax=Tritrichomonas musculus TaxID=1915356 RepID=A0ABR2KHH9_9EUKA